MSCRNILNIQLFHCHIVIYYSIIKNWNINKNKHFIFLIYLLPNLYIAHTIISISSIVCYVVFRREGIFHVFCLSVITSSALSMCASVPGIINTFPSLMPHIRHLTFQEINFGIIRAGKGGVLLRSIELMLRRIFVPAVRLNPGPSAGGTARDHLLAGLRAFASCLNGERRTRRKTREYSLCVFCTLPL